jgi:hypothetical protein
MLDGEAGVADHAQAVGADRDRRVQLAAGGTGVERGLRRRRAREVGAARDIQAAPAVVRDQSEPVGADRHTAEPSSRRVDCRGCIAGSAETDSRRARLALLSLRAGRSRRPLRPHRAVRAVDSLQAPRTGRAQRPAEPSLPARATEAARPSEPSRPLGPLSSGFAEAAFSVCCDELAPVPRGVATSATANAARPASARAAPGILPMRATYRSGGTEPSDASASRAASCSAAFFEAPVPTPACTPSMIAAHVNERSCGGPSTSSTV